MPDRAARKAYHRTLLIVQATQSCRGMPALAALTPAEITLTAGSKLSLLPQKAYTAHSSTTQAKKNGHRARDCAELLRRSNPVCGFCPGLIRFARNDELPRATECGPHWRGAGHLRKYLTAWRRATPALLSAKLSPAGLIHET